MEKSFFVSILVILTIVIFLVACQSTGLKPSEGFIDVTGGKIWYKIVGEGDKTPLLVIHGASTSSVYLKPLEVLADERPVIFYDQLTCGNSKAPNDTSLWTIERFVEEITFIRNALNLDEIHLYGHSWGTMLATDYMLTEPEGIKSLILASPVLNLPLQYQNKISLLHTMPDSLVSTILINEQNGTLDSPEYQSAMMVYYTTFFARRLPWSDDLIKAFAVVNFQLMEHLVGNKQFICSGILCDYNITGRLNEIIIPTLLMAGEFDTSTPEAVATYHKEFPNSEMRILENCGHLTMQDNPEENANIIRLFLKNTEN
jgi:proline iminopeptidase